LTLQTASKTTQQVTEALKKELCMTNQELAYHFIFQDNGRATILKQVQGTNLEFKTWTEFNRVMHELGGIQNPEKPHIWEIPYQQNIETASYSLSASKAGLGELDSVKVAIINDIEYVVDGFHRLGENANWRKEILPWIDNLEKLELARLAINFNRRNMGPKEVEERVVNLLNMGFKAEEISTLTGISESTIYKYKPQTLKNPQKVEAGKAAAEARAEAKFSAPSSEHTVKTQDTESITMEHTGSDYIDMLSECEGCHLMIHKDQLKKGLCEDCRKKAETASQQVAVEQVNQPQIAKPISFLVQLPLNVKVTAQSLERYFKTAGYEDDLPQRIIRQTQEGLLVTFDYDEWKKYTNGSEGTEIEIFRAELGSILENEEVASYTEVQQATILQVEPKGEEHKIVVETPEMPSDEEIGKSVHDEIANTSLTVPCLTCVNDSENGGDCYREKFHIKEDGTAYVCASKRTETDPQPAKSIQQVEQRSVYESRKPVICTDECSTCDELECTQRKNDGLQVNAQTETTHCCPMCKCSQTPEEHAMLKTAFGNKYPELFGETTAIQKVVTCGCGAEILIVPDVAAMSKAIEQHAKECINLDHPDKAAEQQLELDLTKDALVTLLDDAPKLISSYAKAREASNKAGVSQTPL
jgi:hypothetical protein